MLELRGRRHTVVDTILIDPESFQILLDGRIGVYGVVFLRALSKEVDSVRAVSCCAVNDATLLE